MRILLSRMHAAFRDIIVNGNTWSQISWTKRQQTNTSCIIEFRGWVTNRCSRTEIRDRESANSVTDAVLQPSTIERIEVFREQMQRINFVVYITSQLLQFHSIKYLDLICVFEDNRDYQRFSNSGGVTLSTRSPSDLPSVFLKSLWLLWPVR